MELIRHGGREVEVLGISEEEPFKRGVSRSRISRINHRLKPRETCKAVTLNIIISEQTI